MNDSHQPYAAAEGVQASDGLHRVAKGGTIGTRCNLLVGGAARELAGAGKQVEAVGVGD